MRIIRPYELTTAEILYGLPDHPLLVQTYVWQEIDLPPEFPRLMGFLRFWKKNLEGPLRGVRVVSGKLLIPDFRSQAISLQVH